MKRIISFLLAFVFVITVSGLVSCSGGQDGPEVPDGTGDDSGKTPEEEVVPAGKSFYVSPEGNDGNEGTKESPLASLEGARAAVSAYKAGNGIPEGGIEVIFAPGTYQIKSQILFSPDDSGEEGKNIVFRAEKSGEVIFDGGVTIDPSLFVPASDEDKARLSDDAAKPNLLVADLTAAGCYDLDDTKEYTTGWTCYSYRQELYVDNVRQTIARWPNSGYERVSAYGPDEGYPYFTLPDGKAQAWSEEACRFYGYPVYDWASVNLQENSLRIDPDSGILEFTGSTGYTISGTSGIKYFLYNIFSEIDVPGEYYWDVAGNRLFYYPDGDISGKKISFSQLADNWFEFDGASYIGFEGIIFENGRADVFHSTNADTYGITVDRCVFRDLGGYAIDMRGNRITVSNSEFYNLGAGCISLSGGDLGSLKSAGSVIYNNAFHDWSQTYTVYNAAANLSGYGFTVSHNEMYNSPHEAIAFNCGGTLIEYNHIHDVCNQTGDAGAVYSGRRWDWSGNIIRFNLIEDIVDTMFGAEPNGIYLDDNLSGQICYGNILSNISGLSYHIGGGKKNYVVNNIFIGGSPVSWDDRGTGNQFAHDAVTYPKGSMWSGILKNVDYLSDMQRFAVPENLLMIEQTGLSFKERPDDPGSPAYGVVINNIYIGERDRIIRSVDNGTAECNLVYAEDPGFVDLENGNYNLKEDSRVFRDLPGFENIDSTKIGLIK